MMQDQCLVSIRIRQNYERAPAAFFFDATHEIDGEGTIRDPDTFVAIEKQSTHEAVRLTALTKFLHSPDPFVVSPFNGPIMDGPQGQNNILAAGDYLIDTTYDFLWKSNIGRGNVRSIVLPDSGRDIATAIPETSSLLLLGPGIVLLAAMAWRQAH